MTHRDSIQSMILFL